MFGPADKNDKNKELERLAENTRRRTTALTTAGFEYAQKGDASRLEKTITLLRDAVKNPKLPRDLVDEVLRTVREMQLVGYRIVVDRALHNARAAAMAHDDKRKHQLIKEARDYLPKALNAGAGEQFKVDTNKLIEIIQLTGTAVAPPEGTAAKPIDPHAPPTAPNRAKGEALTSDVRSKLLHDAGDGRDRGMLVGASSAARKR